MDVTRWFSYTTSVGVAIAHGDGNARDTRKSSLSLGHRIAARPAREALPVRYRAHLSAPPIKAAGIWRCLPTDGATASGEGENMLADLSRRCSQRRFVVGQPATTQQAYTAILSHFIEHGRAPHYVELAATLGIGIEEARTLQRDAAASAPAASCWLSHDSDYIEAWGPFSNVPTHVSISVEGEDRWYGL